MKLRLSVVGFGVALLTGSQVALAQVHFTSPPAINATNNGAGCGTPDANAPRTTLLAGSKVTITFKEDVARNIPFQISFAATGRTNFTQLATVQPVNGAAPITVNQAITVPNTPCTTCTLRVSQTTFLAGSSVSCADIQIVADASALDGGTIGGQADGGADGGVLEADAGDDQGGGGDDAGGGGNIDDPGADAPDAGSGVPAKPGSIPDDPNSQPITTGTPPAPVPAPAPPGAATPVASPSTQPLASDKGAPAEPPQMGLCLCARTGAGRPAAGVLLIAAALVFGSRRRGDRCRRS